MIMIQTGRTISLPCGVNDIKSVAINHCNFYFLDCNGCQLIRWSPNEPQIETIPLERKYLCICYDHKENCYWAVPEYKPHLIYQLDACFCEVGNISIRGAYQQRPVSLCCDICENCLCVCYPCQVAHVEKCSGQTTWDKVDDSRRTNLGVIIRGECRARCYCESNRQIMALTSHCDGESMELCIQKEYRVIGMTPCCCNHSCKECRFCVLLLKVCSHELILMEYCIDFSNGIIDPCCPHPCPPGPCPPPGPPDPCPPPCPPGPHCGSYEIMHSIALEEAGIAHILNAEGEKIQKAVACSNNIDELICVNESVKRTLTQVTLLEGMLYSKLEALVSCNDCCHDSCHDKDSCR